MFGCIQDTLVVVVDNLFSVIHATVANLDGIAAEDFSEFVLFREVFVYYGEESVTDVGVDVFAEWGLYQRMLLRCLFLRLAVAVGS